MRGSSEALDARVRSTRPLLHLEVNRLWTVLVILMVLWLLGMLSGAGGGLIHLLLVVGVIVVIFKMFSGRRGLA